MVAGLHGNHTKSNHCVVPYFEISLVIVHDTIRDLVEKDAEMRHHFLKCHKFDAFLSPSRLQHPQILLDVGSFFQAAALPRRGSKHGWSRRSDYPRWHDGRT